MTWDFQTLWLLPALPAFLAWWYYDGYPDAYRDILGALMVSLIPGLNILYLALNLFCIYYHWTEFGHRGLGWFHKE
jgi:hypothetical protein